MFSVLPFEKELVDLENYEIGYKVLDNAGDGSLYFGNRVACSRFNEGKDETFYAKYNLKKRPYLGPTSTDHELSFLMANQGQVREGDFVYDPFVGTGSIAMALQHFKAFVFGSDLDIRVIKGYGVGRKTKNAIEGLDQIEKFDITTNFKFFGIPTPDFWIQDIHSSMLQTQRAVFDSIVCDPPYGVRARTHKVGIADKDRYEERKMRHKPDPDREPDELDNFHASMKEQYAQKDIYADTLDLGSKLLRIGGRIVFLWHTDDEKSDEENKFPEHPSFEFVCSSKDVLTKHRARWLITMTKVK